MTNETYYSVRMRAALGGPHENGGKHISGGEKISTFANLQSSVNYLLEKGLHHSKGTPDFLQIQLEQITEPIQVLPPLHVQTLKANDVMHGQQIARELLQKIGIDKHVVEKAFSHLTHLQTIRGAILVDAKTGDRLDSQQDRGVRVSRFDWETSNFTKWASHFKENHSPRVKEAIELATKVCRHPATIAELCWSDDPEYVTGYVASQKYGYQRITKLKEVGDDFGIRIFFIDASQNLDEYISYLEKQPIFIQWEENLHANINGKK